MDSQKINVSDEAVHKATGKSWTEWFKILDDLGAEAKSHKEIAHLLQVEGLIKKPKSWPANRSFSEGWWAQSVTVAYEKARGKRILGQTADAGFQIGVQKTLPISPEAAWQLITSAEGLKIWLGITDKLEFRPGETYETTEGTSGQIRTVDEGSKLRLTWQPKDRPKPSTLQIYLLPAGSKTSVRFHHEKLSDSIERQRMKKHWQTALGKLQKLV